MGGNALRFVKQHEERRWSPEELDFWRGDRKIWISPSVRLKTEATLSLQRSYCRLPHSKKTLNWNHRFLSLKNEEEKEQKCDRVFLYSVQTYRQKGFSIGEKKLKAFEDIAKHVANTSKWARKSGATKNTQTKNQFVISDLLWTAQAQNIFFLFCWVQWKE